MLRNVFIKDGAFRLWILYTFIGVVVIVGGYWVYATWNQGNTPLKSPWMCMTEGCGYTAERVPKLGDPPPPQVCPKCGKKSLVPPHACPHRGELVIVNEWRGLPPPTICPHCGKEINLARY